MVISIDITTVIAVGSALGLAAAAVAWAFRRYDELRKVPGLVKRVEGDPEAKDPKDRDGIIDRLEDVENDARSSSTFIRGLRRALRIHPTSDEHEIADAILDALRDGRISEMRDSRLSMSESTGSHHAVILPPLPPPVARPTPHRGPAIPREEPEPEKR